jgi:hypothetical protein
MDDMIRIALELMLIGGVVLALVGSVVLFLHEGLGFLMVRLGTLSMLAFCMVAAFIFLGVSL